MCHQFQLEKSLSEAISGWDGEGEEGVRSEDGDSGEIVVEEWQFSALTQLKEVTTTCIHPCATLCVPFLFTYIAKSQLP